MSRQKKLIPAYRKHRASGQAIVTVSGRTCYLGPHGTQASHLEYDRVIAEWLARGRTPEQEEDASPALVELCARYLEFARGYYQKDGRCTKVVPGIKSTIRYLKEYYGRTPARDFGPLALKALRERMIQDGHSRRYINDHVARVKRLFKWAASEQLVPQATYQALALVSGLRKGKTQAHETTPILPVDQDVVDATLPHLSTVVGDMVRLQKLTGMRPSEVCALRPRDLDRSEETWVLAPASHKTEHHGRSRLIFVGPRGKQLLAKYLFRDDQECCFRPCDAEAGRSLPRLDSLVRIGGPVEAHDQAGVRTRHEGGVSRAHLPPRHHLSVL
ncbi:MAG: hypothetical protein KDA57_16255 [Planctomycetales bacterium]|nr:hypothetical protein [Planctomycetales bacterium]